MKKVALYLRVSSREKAIKGLSLEAQKDTLTKYAKSKGYKIVDYYIDAGKSAHKNINKRLDLQRLIVDIKDNKIDIVIFIKLDRWTRNVKDYYKLDDILKAHNVDFECALEQYNTNTSNGRLHLNIKLSIAQNEAEQTSDRIKYVFQSKRDKGEVTSGR